MTTVLQDKQVVTRKPHKCFGCLRELPARTQMRFIVQVECGEMGSSYWCPTCQRYWDLHMDPDDEGIMEGDLKSNDPEGWERTRAEAEDGVPEPRGACGICQKELVLSTGAVDYGTGKPVLVHPRCQRQRH